jgi:hypothetical protein
METISEIEELVLEMLDLMILDTIEDLIQFNLSFDIPIEDTLKKIDRLDLLEYFIENNLKNN